MPLPAWLDNADGDDWFGLKPTGTVPATPPVAPPVAPPGVPAVSLDERARRCREMGLVLCTCSSVQRKGKAVLIYNPACPVHPSAA